MPSLSVLVDNFNSGLLGPEWGNSYGGTAIVDGRARVPCTTGYAGCQTAYSWTMAGASWYVEVPTVPAASTAAEAYCGVMVQSQTAGTRVGFIINSVTGLLRCKNEVGYYDAESVDIPYSAVDHRWLRMREDGTNLYWDTSPDGATWTTQRTLATPAWILTEIDTCALDMSAHRDAGTDDYAEYDQFNTLSDGAVFVGGATLSAVSDLTSTLRASARGTASLSAETVLAAAPVLTAHAAAALAADATLVADAADTEIPEVAGLAAGIFDLCIEQGATYIQNFTVIDVPGFTWDGWTARSQIRSAAASDHGDLLLDLTPHLTVIGDTIRLAIPAAVTETLTRNGLWDLEVAQGGTVVRLLQGRASVSLEVTR
ncbi:hypothetical protein [Streptomyces lancefieldiae]|uniref:Uncharacterized protein n=1 Tax=Streptomyces lancefieldiae TaxID=3075520 RepID=A0ABU3AIG9_9ACTN|nr:hypothetical protein [Streptomyces sp. DSM 40712]MDT0608863.1 hypothetical protein [Streptomyces sp. DSM 40712]